MKKAFNRNDGFTLVELIVAMAMAVIVTAAATSVLLLGLRVNRQTADTASQQITVRTLLFTVENIISEGNVAKIEMNTESWKITDANGKVLISYLYNNDKTEKCGAVYVGDYEDYGDPKATEVATPVLTGLLSSYVELYDGLFTIHVETKEGIFSSTVYCRSFAPETDNNVSNGDSFVTEEDGNDQKILFLNALKSQYRSRGEIRENGEDTGIYYSEWYIGGYEQNPGWNAKTPWCACYVSWALARAGLTCPEGYCPEGKHEGHPNWFANVDEFMAYFKDTTRSESKWYDADEYEPKAGDLIFFNWNKGDNPQHVGVVLDVRNNGGITMVYTIEGNSAGRVTVRSYPLTDERIIGYGVIFTT